ncbi:MAG TPA: type II toxin-antitoxin system VapC family toxin [Bryobacteraceae bacterium]|nr:type II toxin-antitoxin system VapC family toxin [Bryobacteraceae bacterium]
MILADTDVLIDYLAGIQPVKDVVAGYADAGQLQTTAVNCFELLSGAGPGKRGQTVRRLIEVLNVLPLDRTAAERAAEVRRKLERAGRPIGMGDSLIAGIALAHGLPLLTRNRSHFERVENLKLVDIPAAPSR